VLEYIFEAPPPIQSVGIHILGPTPNTKSVGIHIYGKIYVCCDENYGERIENRFDKNIVV
jgi:hypothetical protein